MISKNESTRIPWLILSSNILSLVAVGFFIFGLYFGFRFFYFNIDIAFCMGYILCGVMLFPLIGILHDIGEDRFSFFLSDPPKDDGIKRYSIFRFLFSFLCLSIFTMFLMSLVREEVQKYFVGVIMIILALNFVSFTRIEIYREELLKKKRSRS